MDLSDGYGGGAGNVAGQRSVGALGRQSANFAWPARMAVFFAICGYAATQGIDYPENYEFVPW
jgi:hypothetical protein